MEVLNVKQLDYDENQQLSVEVGICPGCNGLIGIDWTYLDQVDNCITCPMCGTQLEFNV